MTPEERARRMEQVWALYLAGQTITLEEWRRRRGTVSP